MSDTNETREGQNQDDFQNQSFERESQTTDEIRQEAMDRREGRDSGSGFDEAMEQFHSGDARLDDSEDADDAEPSLDDSGDAEGADDAEAQLDDSGDAEGGDDAEPQLDDSQEETEADESCLDGPDQGVDRQPEVPQGRQLDGDGWRPEGASWGAGESGASSETSKEQDKSSDTHRVADQSERADVERGRFARELTP